MGSGGISGARTRRAVVLATPDGWDHLELEDVQPPTLGEVIQGATVVNGGWILKRREDGLYQACDYGGFVVTDGIDLSAHTMKKDTVHYDYPDTRREDDDICF